MADRQFEDDYVQLLRNLGYSDIYGYEDDTGGTYYGTKPKTKSDTSVENVSNTPNTNLNTSPKSKTNQFLDSLSSPAGGVGGDGSDPSGNAESSGRGTAPATAGNIANAGLNALGLGITSLAGIAANPTPVGNPTVSNIGLTGIASSIANSLGLGSDTGMGVMSIDGVDPSGFGNDPGIGDPSATGVGDISGGPDPSGAGPSGVGDISGGPDPSGDGGGSSGSGGASSGGDTGSGPDGGAGGGSYAAGGVVKRKPGQPLPPPNVDPGIADHIPAKLSEGEFVIPADVVRTLGETYFSGLIEKARSDRAKMQVQQQAAQAQVQSQQNQQQPAQPGGLLAPPGSAPPSGPKQKPSTTGLLSLPQGAQVP